MVVVRKQFLLSIGGPRKVEAKQSIACLSIRKVANRGQIATASARDRSGLQNETISLPSLRPLAALGRSVTVCTPLPNAPQHANVCCSDRLPTRWRAVGKSLVSSRRVLLNRPFDANMFSPSSSCQGIPVSQNSTGTLLLELTTDIDRYSSQAALRNDSNRFGSLISDHFVGQDRTHLLSKRRAQSW
jgi:hypothetical protein